LLTNYFEIRPFPANERSSMRPNIKPIVFKIVKRKQKIFKLYLAINSIVVHSDTGLVVFINLKLNLVAYTTYYYSFGYSAVIDPIKSIILY
jgi:hypothetical protein